MNQISFTTETFPYWECKIQFLISSYLQLCVLTMPLCFPLNQTTGPVKFWFPQCSGNFISPVCMLPYTNQWQTTKCKRRLLNKPESCQSSSLTLRRRENTAASHLPEKAVIWLLSGLVSLLSHLTKTTLILELWLKFKPQADCSYTHTERRWSAADMSSSSSLLVNV